MTVDAPGPAKAQRRGRRIAMTDAERDEFLAHQRTCRVATISPDGPHLSPLWFAWADGALWLYSIVGSQRWIDLERDNRTAVVVDDGEGYLELRGVEIRGRVTVVGDVPRQGADVPELVTAERIFAQKYQNSTTLTYDGKHAWLRLTPEKIVSWDFRKIG